MATVISRKYEVIGQLGQGGMGVVYKVRHNALDTILALKVLPPELMENPEMITRFYREARVVARMSHPNIVRVLDIERDESLNFHYFVMEYIQGQTFSQFLRERGPLPLIDVLDITRQVARALAYAHNHTPPIIHRDIKPSNIMIEDRSSRVVVMDFGIAKELGDGERTKSGAVIGTLKYCSPEQMRREPLDGSADIYSLGLVMYEAYTGTQFFAGLDETEVIGKVLYDEREHEPQFTRPTPPAFVDLITKAIAKSRARRYWRIEDFLHDLEACWSTLEGGEKDLFPTASLRQDKTRIGGAPEELHEIEEQIRRLEEERQKRLILPLQIQAREARERAAREGAGQWAGAVFQRGLAREESGHAFVRERQYPLAQEAYQEAVSFFHQASEEATAAARFHDAEQARQGMVETKAEAERYGAREKARTFYGRALALLAQAEEQWERKSYKQASEGYSEARGFFADARDLAYRETLKTEASAARAQALAAREAAVAEGAEELSPDTFREAVGQEQRAMTAGSNDEFVQARELYTVAYQQYTLAQQQTRAERQRQHALAVQRDVTEARRQAEAAGADGNYTLYRQAVEAEEQGAARFAAQDYEQAAHAYEQAWEEYDRAAREATQAPERLAAQKARQHMEEAHAAAERSAKGGQYAEAFAQARQLVEQGRRCEEQEQFAAARERYTQATDQFAQLAQEAEHAALSAQVADYEQTVILARQPEVDGLPPATPTNPSIRSWSRTPTLLAVALAVLLGLYVGGVFHRSAKSPAPGPSQPLISQAATGGTATPAVAEPQQPASENGPLAMIPPASPPSPEAVSPPIADTPRFSSVARIAAYTEVPTAKVAITVSPTPRAVLDDQEVAVSADGIVQVTLQNLPPGESQHALRLMDASGAQSQDIPIRVMYYPGWEIRVYAGHLHEAYLVAFSPDGMQAISSSRDKTIKLWDVETGQETGSFVGHADGVFAVAFSPDGKRIISGSDDKTLRLWNVATGQCVRTFVGHKDWINSVAFSPDGMRVVSGSKDKTVKVWNVETGREIRTFAGRMDWVFAVAFAPDGKRIIAGGADNRLRLWDLETGREIRTLTGHTDWITAVAFAPDGHQVISASHDTTLRLWDLKTGRTMQTFVGHEAWVNGVAFAPDGTRIASASKDKTLKLWDISTGQELRTFSGHSGPVIGVAFTPDGRQLLSGSYDKTLKLWWAGTEPTEITLLPQAGAGQ